MKQIENRIQKLESQNRRRQMAKKLRIIRSVIDEKGTLLYRLERGDDGLLHRIND